MLEINFLPWRNALRRAELKKMANFLGLFFLVNAVMILGVYFIFLQNFSRLERDYLSLQGRYQRGYGKEIAYQSLLSQRRVSQENVLALDNFRQRDSCTFDLLRSLFLHWNLVNRLVVSDGKSIMLSFKKESDLLWFKQKFFVNSCFLFNIKGGKAHLDFHNV